MNEVSTISTLVIRLIGFAIGIGCLGTMYDLAVSTQKDAKQAIVRQQISYSQWNRILLKRQ
jgi:hypothetical protein